MPTEPFAEIRIDDLATVDGGLTLRNAAYAGFVAASFLVGQPAGPKLDSRPPIVPIEQTIGGQ